MNGERPTPGSPRIMLATLAQDTVAEASGVALTAGEGERWVTVDRHHRIAGVTAVAQGDGRIELGLYLDVSWPPAPLHQLAEDLRARVRAGAERERLADRLGEVLVTIADVEGPDEPGVVA